MPRQTRLNQVGGSPWCEPVADIVEANLPAVDRVEAHGTRARQIKGMVICSLQTLGMSPSGRIDDMGIFSRSSKSTSRATQSAPESEAADEMLAQRMRAASDVPLAKLSDEAVNFADWGRQIHDMNVEKLVAEAGLKPGARVGVSLGTGEFIWFGTKGKVVSNDLQIIGMRSVALDRWQWAWADSSVPDALLVASKAVRDYGMSEGIAVLTQSSCACRPDEQWPLCHLAVGLGLGHFVQRMPKGDLEVYLLLGNYEVQPL